MKSEKQTLSLPTLYSVLNAIFCVIVVISNLISAKMVTIQFLNLTIPAGLITYPLTFLLSDLVNEIFGPRAAKLMVYTAFGVCLLSFCLIELSICLPTEAVEMQIAFPMVLGLSGLRMFSSLVAYIFSQIADIKLYAWIKSLSGEKWLWLRNNGSTCISQMVDTIIIDMIFLFWGLSMGLKEVVPIMAFSFMYKAIFSVLCTPLFYLGVYILQKKKTENSSNFLIIQN